MTRTPVKSSQIVSIGYDAATETLEIEFNGAKVYQYENVPVKMHREIMASESPGSYFFKHIKSQPQAFPMKKL